jgi:PBP1b-binding outer membrane lipoprotein LpoB
MKKLLAIVMALMLSAALVITGCSSTTTTPTTGSTTPPAQQGTLQLLVTDAPPQKEVTAIELTISTIAVHAAQSQAELQEPAVTPGASTESESVENGMVTGTNEATTGWITIDPAENATFDLLQIKDIEESLAAQLLEAGKYTQIRLTVEKARVGLDRKSVV